MATIDRAISTFDAASRQTLTNGGTVVGGNGITYIYDPLSGMAVNANAGTTSTAAAAPTAGATAIPATPTDTSEMGMTGVALAGPQLVAEEEPPIDLEAEKAKWLAERDEADKRETDDRARRDAYARLNTVLTDYGLGTLGATVQAWLIEGLSEAEIVQRMRETPEFKTRFPAIEERKRKGLAPISPGEYVAYERQARQMMRAAGIPEGFYDSNDDFKNFLTNDLSLAELGDRVTLAANAAFKMPKEARDALTRWGMGPGDLTAFWLDPDKAQPLLERKYAAAQLAGSATRTQFGELDETQAGRLAGLGVTEQQAEQGFGALYDARELFNPLERGEEVVGQDEQLGAAFEGNSNARRRIEQQRRRRQARFESGGGFAAGQGGIAGLGDTSA